MDIDVRLAEVADARACAQIVNDWIDRTTWLPRTVSHAALVEMLEQGIPMREFWIAGDPVQGYLSFNTDALQVMGLYTAVPGQGIGKALMDRVKGGRDWIQLWSHAANLRAHGFYRREGFVEVGRRKEGVDGIPEIRMEWRA